jgi:serine/threonine protein kinase
MEVYINKKRIRLNPLQTIGKGGEADVFDIGGGKALKLFKPADHPDFLALPDGLREQEQNAAIARLAIHQQKLAAFPQNLPQRVVKPESLATDKQGQRILGYVMPLLKGTTPLLKYSDRTFRSTSGIGNQAIGAIFQDLHSTISQLHLAKVAIGDFNDLNVLILKDEAYLIDTDSFQYGNYTCGVFTSRFVDPLLCDRQQSKPMLQQPHNFDSDWYAFAVMLMQSLLFVDPYGGVYKPKDVSAKIPHEARSLHRITIFHPEVKYPKPAIPYKVLPDDFLDYFYQCLERDRRIEFPQSLLESMRWQKCSTCGIEHARNCCPICNSVSIPVIAMPRQSGTCTVQTIFTTEGIILCASLESALNINSLIWIYHDRGEFKREDHTVILTGELDSQLQFGLQGKSTLIGKQRSMITLTSHSPPQVQTAERFAANKSSRYWIANGQLVKDGKLGTDSSEYIGDVLSGHTQFWVGSHFGFGFYRAGELNVSFVFDPNHVGINDRVKLPAWQGELIDATCSFSQEYCWFFTVTQEQGKIIHRVSVIRSTGEVITTLALEKNMLSGSANWLDSIHGKYAVSKFLLAATDEGIVRIEVQNGQITQAKTFPETEPYVDANSQLFVAPDGVYVVSQRKIEFLKIT